MEGVKGGLAWRGESVCKMRRFIYAVFALVLIASIVVPLQIARQPSPALANAVETTSVTLTGQNASDNYTYIQFDIGWNYSWHDGVNWDAAWVFVKYKETGGVWNHATLSATDSHHSVTTTNGVAATIDAASDGMGAFIYRTNTGHGTNNWDRVKLRWNYGTDGVADDAIVYVKVFAIEMVYIPERSFSLRNGESDNLLSNFNSGNTIGSEAEIVENTIQWSVESDWCGALDPGADPYTARPNNGGNAALCAGYPKGYQAIYCMKYGLSQRQYAEFLNTLTATQATNRYPNHEGDNRHYITKVGDTYGCDANSNDILNESDDGEWTACNYISWSDGLAYADWAGLRPMTELEYEKICRGPEAAGDEYAWGNTSVAGSAYTISNDNQADAFISAASYADDPNGNASYATTDGALDGPLRCGIFATATSTRAEAGASYYGVMEMSGNLYERCVTVAKYCYGGDSLSWNHETNAGDFDGLHGDGSLTDAGYANVARWPSPTATSGYTTYGSGRRGGGWSGPESDLRVSGRLDAALPDACRRHHYGFRLLRTE